jgi:hypothetical protein
MQAYFLMNNAGNMVQIQNDQHRINNVIAGAETSEYYLSLLNAGTLNDVYSWTTGQFQPLGSLAPNLGSSSAGNRWGTFYGAGVNANSPTAGVGYATGAGGTVTQLTSRATGVTLNALTGNITMFAAAGSATPSFFTVTNSAVAASDLIILNIRSGPTNYYHFGVSTVTTGSFSISFWTTGGTAVDTPVISFAVIKGATA